MDHRLRGVCTWTLENDDDDVNGENYMERKKTANLKYRFRKTSSRRWTDRIYHRQTMGFLVFTVRVNRSQKKQNENPRNKKKKKIVWKRVKARRKS